MYSQRMQRLHTMLDTAGLDGIALNAGPSLRYLTGLRFGLSERPVVLLLKKNSKPAIVLPEFETGQLEAINSELEIFSYNEDIKTWAKAFNNAAIKIGLNNCKFGIVPTHIRFLELDFLKNAAPQAKFVSASPSIDVLRMKKDEAEIHDMKKAAQIAQDAFLATVALAKSGMSEKEFASELVAQLLQNGSEPNLPFMPIVASGPNGANPHATPGERKFAPGDLVVVDWGATCNGYFSDITRTLAIGEISDESKKIAQIVKDANAAGKAAVKPGISAQSIDHAARKVISDAGYCEYFTTRTGHGLGIEVHEPPYMNADNQLLLEEGFTFTVEPGIYLSGKAGVRIEDDVVVRKNGVESLTTLDRDLYSID